MLSMLLETRGYFVETAGSALETFQKVSSDYDLILLDLVLPDFNGMEVCRRLKQGRQTRHIPIIMLSAHALYEDRVEALYLGADDFLSKPCEHEELFARMEAVLRRGTSGNGKKNNHEEMVIFELRKILNEALLIPHFQPIYLFNPFRLYGIEILTRPIAKGILASPETFFKAAIQYGLYTEMEMLSWSLALSCLSKFINEEKIFLNCNPYFIESAQFDRVCAIFEKNKISPKNVILEITERSAITNFKLFYEQLHKYRDYGFRFAVDDVGGGYASLESIVETKPEVVKIDRHIVKGMTTDVYKQSIIKFIAAFCKENNIISIAEGIETAAELKIIRDIGIDAGQGYFLYRPTPEINLPNFNKILC